MFALAPVKSVHVKDKPATTEVVTGENLRVEVEWDLTKDYVANSVDPRTFQDNGGLTWSVLNEWKRSKARISRDWGHAYVVWLNFTTGASNNVFTGNEDFGQWGESYKDAGGSALWTLTQKPARSADIFDSNHIAITNEDGVYRTEDGGTTWENITPSTWLAHANTGEGGGYGVRYWGSEDKLRILQWGTESGNDVSQVWSTENATVSSPTWTGDFSTPTVEPTSDSYQQAEDDLNTQIFTAGVGQAHTLYYTRDDWTTNGSNSIGTIQSGVGYLVEQLEISADGEQIGLAVTRSDFNLSYSSVSRFQVVGDWNGTSYVISVTNLSATNNFRGLSYDRYQNKWYVLYWGATSYDGVYDLGSDLNNISGRQKVSGSYNPANSVQGLQVNDGMVIVCHSTYVYQGSTTLAQPNDNWEFLRPGTVTYGDNRTKSVAQSNGAANSRIDLGGASVWDSFFQSDWEVSFYANPTDGQPSLEQAFMGVGQDATDNFWILLNTDGTIAFRFVINGTIQEAVTTNSLPSGSLTSPIKITASATQDGSEVDLTLVVEGDDLTETVQTSATQVLTNWAVQYSQFPLFAFNTNVGYLYAYSGKMWDVFFKNGVTTFAHYKLEEETGSYALDSSGNANTGTIVGSGISRATTSEGVVSDTLDPYVYFNGTTSDYLDAGTDWDALFSDDFEIEFDFDLDDGLGVLQYLIGWNNLADDNFSIRVQSDGTVQLIYISNTNGGNGTATTGTLPNGQTGWHHLRAKLYQSSDDVRYELEITGDSLNETVTGVFSNTTMSEFDFSNNLYIGARNNNTVVENPVAGRLKNISFYDDERATYASYDLNANANDGSGNSRNATVNGDVWFGQPVNVTNYANSEGYYTAVGGGTDYANTGASNALTAGIIVPARDDSPTNSAAYESDDDVIALGVEQTPYLTLVADSGNIQNQFPVVGSRGASLIFEGAIQAGDYDDDKIITVLSNTINGRGIGETDPSYIGASVDLSTVTPDVSMNNVSINPKAVASAALFDQAQNLITGDTLSITVNFDRAVTVTGTPRIPLALDSGTIYLTYSSGSGTTALVFDYTLTGTDIDLNGVTAQQIDLNSGTILGNGRAATLTYGTPSFVNTINDSASLVSAAFNQSAILNTGETISIDVVFSDSVTVTGTPRIPVTLDSGTIYLDYTSGSGTNTLTFAYAITSSDYDVGDTIPASQIDLNSGTIKDTSTSTDVTLFYNPAPNYGYVINPLPVVDLVEFGQSANVSSGDTLSVNVTFDVAVVVTGTPTIPVTLDSGEVTLLYTAGSGTTTLTFAYTVQGQDSELDKSAAAGQIALAGGTITSGSNAVAATLTYTAPTFLYNVNAPNAVSSVAITSSQTGKYSLGQTMTIQATFDEIVTTVTGIPRIPITLDTGTKYATYTSGEGTNVLTFQYTVEAGDIDYNSGIVIDSPIEENGGTIKTNGNDVTLTFTPVTYPLITIVAVEAIGISTNSDVDYTTGEEIEITVQFSQSVDITGTPRLLVALTTGNVEFNYKSGSGSDTIVFSYTVQIDDVANAGVTAISPFVLAESSNIQYNGGDIGLQFDQAIVDVSLGTITINFIEAGPAATKFSTFKSISEQIIRLYRSGDITESTSLKFREIEFLVRQHFAEIVKLETVENSTDLDKNALGIDPPSATIAVYEGVQVQNDPVRGVNFVELPLYPIRLKMNMGVWAVAREGDEDNEFIPISTGMKSVMKGLPAANLQGQVGWTQEGRKLILTSKLLDEVPATTTVVVKMIVLDVSKLQEYDPLPIDQSTEKRIINDVLDILKQRQEVRDQANDQRDQR